MCRNEGSRLNCQAARKSRYDHKGKGALRTMAGYKKVDPLTGLLQGIKTLKDKVSQLHSEVKNYN